MKPINRIVGLAGLLCLSVTLMTGCLKNNPSAVVNQPAGLISVINTSPGTGPVDFTLEPNRVNRSPIQYGNGLDYFAAYTGKRTADFYSSGSTVALKSDTLTVVDGHYYSLYLVGNNIKEVLRLNDTVTRPAASMIGLRLVNVSPDAPAVDLAIQGGAVIAKNKTYKSYSGFVPVAGDKAYILEIRQAGTTNVLATLNSTTFHSDAIYTVWLQGLVAAPTDDTKLKAGLQQNVYWY